MPSSPFYADMHKILVVEDYEPDFELIQRVLERNGPPSTLRLATSVDDLLAQASDWKPDLILTDFQLRAETALDVLERLKHKSIDTPVILVTGSQTDETAVKCLKAGAVDYLLKSNLVRLPAAATAAIAAHEARLRAERLHRFFDGFMRHLPGAAAIMDQAGRYVFANETMVRWLQRPPQELIGSRPADVFPRSVSSEVDLLSQEAFRLSQPVSFMVDVPYPDRSRRLLIQKFNLDLDNGQRFIGSIGIDVSDKLQLQSRLALSETKYQRLTELVSDVTFDIDLERDKIEWSEGLARVYGYAPESIDLTLGWFLDRIHPEDREHLRAIFQPAKPASAAPERLDLTLRIRCADRSYRHTELHVWLYYEADAGIPVRAIGALRDVTKARELEAQLRAAKDQAEQASQLKTSFLANMSHEIRTPMNAILGFTDLLLEEGLPQHAGEYLGVIRRSGNRLLETINSILDIAMIESNRVNYEPRRVPVEPAIAEAVDLILPLARNKQLLVEYEVERDLAVWADPQLLHRVLVNLLGNAVKFTDQGGVRITATSESAGSRKRAAIAVSDTGIGISEQDRSKIFHAFEQADAGFARAYEGNGLGLAIASSYVRILGGEISVESEPGRGSTFTVRLPVMS